MEIKKQHKFLEEKGYLHLKNVLSQMEVNNFKQKIQQACETKITQQNFTSNHLPILTNSNRTDIQRFPFINFCESTLTSQVTSLPILFHLENLFNQKYIIGFHENDGVVYTKYQADKTQHHKLGWHMDGGKSWLKGRRIIDFYNVGIHLSDCSKEMGGLRVLEGSHYNYPLYNVCIKPSFLDHRADIYEKIIETKAGDITIHHSNLLHRVAPSIIKNNIREVLYFSLIPEQYQKHFSITNRPFYWKAFRFFSNISK